MRRFFGNLGAGLRRWMIGRYGADELSRFLMWCGIILLIAAIFKPVAFLAIPAWIILLYSYFRCFSRNIVKRSKERDVYLRITGKFKSRFSILKKRWRDRNTHVYYRCPGCRTTIRVPRGRGRIAISCPKCRREFIKTT